MNASLAALLFWISVAVCALAELAIVAATARASRRASDPRIAGIPGDVPEVDGARPLPATRRWLEVLYAAAPALVLALLFVFTWRAMHPSPVRGQSSAESASVLPLVAGPVSTR